MGRAWAVVLWERLWLAVWPATVIVALFLALALFDILPLLPGWLHALVLVLFTLAAGMALAHGLKTFAPPDDMTVRRRLERDSGLPHRPLHALRDRPAPGVADDPMAMALWALHKDRTRRAIGRLRVRLPHPNLAARDPYAVRMLAVLLLVAAGAGARGDWGPRLAAALTPRMDAGATMAASLLDLWVNPPEYTGLPPIFLKQPATLRPATPAGTITVPQGSVVTARVTGGRGPARLDVNGRTVPFETIDPSTFQVQQPVLSGGELTVRQGGNVLGWWPISVVPDAPPVIAFASPPAGGQGGALRLDYEAHDDYGLTGGAAVVRLAGGDGPATAGPGGPGELDPGKLELPLALPGLRPKEARGAAIEDLTPHPWAGLPVTIRLKATDGAGQTGVSDEVAMVLPERAFNHPVARAIIAERRALTLHPQDGRADAAGNLGAISARPTQFSGDIVVFLALRSAVARLQLDGSDDAVPQVQKVLWEAALRIEEGGVSLAGRDLRDAGQRLAQALERNAPEAEIAALMNELQTALDRFLDALDERVRQAAERGEPTPQIPPELARQMVDHDDLQAMMDQMRNLAETGSRDAARQMLSQLRQMLDSLRSGSMAQMQPGRSEAFDLMRDIQDLTRRQQELMEQTFRQGQDQANGSPSPQQRPRANRQASPMMQQNAAQQQALRHQLGELMGRMDEMTGDIPRPLGRAERAMREAETALSSGNPAAASGSQGQAVDQLQQGLQGFAEQMMNQMTGMAGPGAEGEGPRRMGRGRDPLGRRAPGFGMLDNSDVKIPEESDLRRAREILDELRRRASQSTRPQFEREYIDRLLRQF
jgi:uncharacterized protein (TIGR02302 family)